MSGTKDMQQLQTSFLKTQIDELKQQGDQLQHAAKVARHESEILKHQRAYFLDQVTGMSIDNRLVGEEREALTEKVTELNEVIAKLKSDSEEMQVKLNESKSQVGSYKRKFGTVMEYLRTLHASGADTILTDYSEVLNFVTESKKEDTEAEVDDEIDLELVDSLLSLVSEDDAEDSEPEETTTTANDHTES